MSTSSLLSSLLSSGSPSTSSSSIDLSSLLQAMSGSASVGINVNSAVASAVYAARAPERLWQAYQTTLQSQTTDLNSLSTAVSNLETDLNTLNDPLGALSTLSLTSSQSSIVSGSVTSGAVAGTHTVIVGNLSQTASWYSDRVASGSATLAAGTFDIVSGAATTTITVGSGVDTLNQVVSNINTLNLGVTASVINDSSGSRLSIVSNTSGVANDFSISNVSLSGGTPPIAFMGFTQPIVGQDASLTLDGVPVTSATNTVAGVLNGVTLNLNSAAVGTPVSVMIAPNASQVGSAIQSFVSDYNGIISGLNTQFTYNLATQSSGDLSSDSTVRALQLQLQSAMAYVSPAGGAVTTLGGLGISMNNDGTLQINNSTLNNALTNNFSGVQSFLQGGALNGFAKQLSTQLNSFTEPVGGAFSVDLQSIDSSSRALQSQINDFEANYISSLQTNLQSQYSKAEIALQGLPAQQALLNSELGNNTNSKNG